MDGLVIGVRGSMISMSLTRGTLGLVVVGCSAGRLLPAAAALRLNRIGAASVMVGAWFRAIAAAMWAWPFYQNDTWLLPLLRSKAITNSL